MNTHIASNLASVESSLPGLRLDFLAELPDDLLLDRLHELAAREHSVTAELVAHIAEAELRRLYLAQGCASMFSYCTEILHLSESSAYSRIEVARAVRRTPRLLPFLADGSLSLTTIRRLAPVLTPDNCDRLIAVARNRSTREVEALVARERPMPDAPPTIRRLPAGTQHVARRVAGEAEVSGDGLWTGNELGNELANSLGLENRPGSQVTPSMFASGRDRNDASILPLAPERHRVRFTASSEMRERIERLQQLLRHRIPDGDLSAVIDTALIELLQKLEKQKCGARAARTAAAATTEATAKTVTKATTKATTEATTEATTDTTIGATTCTSSREPSASAAPVRARRSRAIPADVRGEVWCRDEGRCAFVSDEGKRCSAVALVEFHHVEAFARGGQATVANIALRCRAHNGYEADRVGLGRRLH